MDTASGSLDRPDRRAAGDDPDKGLVIARGRSSEGGDRSPGKSLFYDRNLPTTYPIRPIKQE